MNTLSSLNTDIQTFLVYTRALYKPVYVSIHLATYLSCPAGSLTGQPEVSLNPRYYIGAAGRLYVGVGVGTLYRAKS